MNQPTPNRSPTRDVSWSLLLVVAGVMTGSLCLLHRNVLYTEGEVMQGLFTLLIAAVAACTLIGFYCRTTALWVVTLFGGLLLLWQAAQNRKWAVIHEDIIGIIQFAERTKAASGQYPATLDGYVFKNARVKGHLRRIQTDDADEFYISYFMNDPGTAYRYSSKTGFGYYPD